MPSGSKVFKGYRALGFVSNHVPLCLRHHQKHNEIYVVTCIGKSFHTYNTSKLGIVSVGTSQEAEIACIAVDAFLIYTAVGSVVKSFARKGREEVNVFRGHDSEVHLLLPFGGHLVSVDKKSHVRVWDIHSAEVYLEMEFDRSSFEVSCLVHPSTYLNKVLFGSRQGLLKLWNIHSNKHIYTFPGWGDPVTVVEQAPAVDVVGIGLSSGKIILHNLKYDETVCSFHQDWGPVTALTFRTDGHPVMLSGSPLGHIAQWDLEERKLQSEIRSAHEGAITGMQCLPSQPLLITSSPDNSIKIWIFDQPDGGGRLLRQRAGHSAPPTKVRYHGNNGQNILSAGQDSTLRSFSTVHEHLDKSLGRASYNKKQTKKSGLKADVHQMPPITDFASEVIRESDWDGLVACHRGEKLVTTWNYQRSTMGEHKLLHPRFSSKPYQSAHATCVDVSPCGNFVAIGYSSGHLDVCNIQSGLHRGSCGENTGHNGSVRGVCIDGLTQLLMTGGADCLVKFWRFKTKKLLHEVKVAHQVAAMILHRESGMLAVSLDDFSISVLDIETQRIVRNFHGHMSRITDMTFSSDSRWLLTSAMDSSLRTWDLPSGRLVDCFLLDAAVTSLTLSPTSDFLVTTHVDDLGVYLWANMTLYTHVSLRPLTSDYQPKVISLPTTQTAEKAEEDSSSDESDSEEGRPEFKSPDQISAELVTLSLLPNSRWQNLLHLDVIKQRNKPREPPKVPKSAPFFLPTIPGLKPEFVKDSSTMEDKKKDSFSQGSFLPMSELGKLLTKAAESKQYSDVLSYMKELGPAAIDLELRSLAPEGGGSHDLMNHFLEFICECLETNRDFELLQAYLGGFLKLHSDLLSREPSLQEGFERLSSTQRSAWDSLEQTFQQSLCLVNYLRAAALS